MDPQTVIQQLTAELDDTRSVLNSKLESLELSARIGKKLLEDNNELAMKYESAVQDFSTRSEVCQEEQIYRR